MPQRVGIALGSNLGDRAEFLGTAANLLKKLAAPGEAFLIASIYRTEPVDCPADSPEFYNTALEIGYAGTAFELLGETQAIEKHLGRVSSNLANAPRCIDIDLLYFGEEQFVSERLILPHPRIHQREFVLKPLAEIRPDLRLPGQLKSIGELAETILSSAIRLVG